MTDKARDIKLILCAGARQYRHNNSDDFVKGYDAGFVENLFESQSARIAELEAALKKRDAAVDSVYNTINQLIKNAPVPSDAMRVIEAIDKAMTQSQRENTK